MPLDGRQHGGHHPIVVGGIPKHLGIAEVSEAQIQNRVARVLGPIPATCGSY
jgi:hypothetical protein